MSNVPAFGDWCGHLNRAEGGCWGRIHAAWSMLDEEGRRSGLPSATTEAKRRAAFSEVKVFLNDAAAWCQVEQERGSWIDSPFTESREEEVIARIHLILNGIGKTLAETATTGEAPRAEQSLCDLQKAYFEKNLIGPRFYDGRVDFNPKVGKAAGQTEPPSNDEGVIPHRPCLERDLEIEGYATEAQNRGVKHWMADARKKYNEKHPDNPLSPGRAGRDVVRQATRKVRKEREKLQGN